MGVCAFGGAIQTPKRGRSSLSCRTVIWNLVIASVSLQ
jgi:hypothetical protein